MRTARDSRTRLGRDLAACVLSHVRYSVRGSGGREGPGQSVQYSSSRLSVVAGYRSMVTHSATMIQQHHEEQQQQLECPNRPRRRMLAKEDPMSHRIIEKRRRDRMNNCLADLSRLIPADYLKKGRGRIEKTEIIEMAIKHIKYLQAQACRQMESCGSPAALEHYRVGYQDCLAEALHFMVEVEGYFAGDPVCVQLVNHLQKHCDKILNGEQLNSPRTATGESSSSSGSCSGGGYGPHAATGSSSGFRSGSSPSSGSGSDVTGGSSKEAPPPPPGVGEVEEDGGGPAPMRDYPAPPDAALPHHAPSSLYKFKNNIKQRFSAEGHTTAPPPSRHQAAKRGRYGSPEDHRRRDSETCPSPPPSPKYDPPPRTPSPVRRGPGVPIFALHSKGSFYVPLTLDPELLAPHLPEAAGGSGPVLHPVTISVNFQRTGGHVGLLDPPPWKTEVTFPKWSLCAQDRP